MNVPARMFMIKASSRESTHTVTHGGVRMFSKTLSRMKKAVRHDFRNLLYPIRYARYFSKGIFLFSGNRILRHPSARIIKEAGRLQFGCFWPLWKGKGGIVLHEDATLIIKGDVVIGDGTIIEIHAGACLEIGSGSFINPNSRVLVQESVRLGSECALAWNVQVMDGDRHFFLDAEGRREKNTAPIHIGDRVWIGSDCLILKGAHIGDGAVVGAGSVVSGKVEKETLVAGNPARKIRGGVRWEV